MHIIENAKWVDVNFGQCQLGNKLRNNRLMVVACNMLEAPSESLPTQNQDWSDLKAAYNLFDRPESTLENIAAVHWSKTRATTCKHVLLISDTTDIDHIDHKATTGLGMLGNGEGAGFQLHSCLMVDSQNKSILGVAGAKFYDRKPVRKGETRAERLKRDRESLLWGSVVDLAGPQPEQSNWIHVFDRGGDNFEAICHIIQNNCGWVIRAAQLQRKVVNENGRLLPLKTAMKSATHLGSYELYLRTRSDSTARWATIEVSSMRIKMPRPSVSCSFVKDSGILEIETNVLIVKEVNATKDKPIQWILLTNQPVNTLKQAMQVIEYYENRWLIEEYHKCLKTGCGVQQHALRTADRLKAVTAITSVIATRLLSLKMDARNAPDTPAQNRVPPMWLKALKALRPKVAKKALTVYEFFREVAKLGGFLARKSDGEPGWQTIWRGFNKLLPVVRGMELALRHR